MKTSKTLFAFLLVTVAVWVLAPLADLTSALAQVPPPALPPSPDQSVISGTGIAAIAALIFGAWRLMTRNKR